jgi:hypothetical protein
VNLRILVDQKFKKNATKLAEAVGTAPAYIHQVLNINSTRNLGGQLAREIEVSLKLPHGWMDAPHKDMKIDFSMDIDRELLVSIVKAVESCLLAEKIRLDGEKKGRLIARLYTHYLSIGGSPDIPTIIDFIRLAA